MTIERILCPVDLSLESGMALRYATALARSFEARLFVLHCADKLPAQGTRARAEACEDLRSELVQMVELCGGCERDLPALGWEPVVCESDDPAEAISAQAAQRDADLIVMCSRRRPTRAALFGSTAEGVYRTAPCPVLIMHPDGREWGRDEKGNLKLSRVLVAHDFSDHSEFGLRHGLALAQEYQSEVHLLHVIAAPPANAPEISWTETSAELAYHKMAGALRLAVPPEVHNWCEVRQSVRWGKPYREILAYAREYEIDLVCMGAHGSGFGMQALFGSNVDRVLRQSSCPVLVARPLKPAGISMGEGHAMARAPRLT